MYINNLYQLYAPYHDLASLRRQQPLGEWECYVLAEKHRAQNNVCK